MVSFPRKGPWAGRVALVPALRRVAGMGWMLRLPPRFWELGRAGVVGSGQRKIPWDSSRATAEPQGTAKEEDCPRSFVGVVSTQKMLPKGSQARSPHLTGTAGRGRAISGKMVDAISPLPCSSLNGWQTLLRFININ